MVMKNITIGIIFLLFFCGFAGILNFENVGVEAKTIYVGGSGAGNKTTIQAAVDAANTGDTIYVYAGTYQENVVISKTINLIGESRNKTTIDGNCLKDVIQINSNWVKISGFTIINSGINSMDAGVELNKVKNCTISDNNISSNGHYGIYIEGSNPQQLENKVKNNIISYNNYSGIGLIGSSKNFISNNNIRNNNNKNSNTDGGIKLYLWANYNQISNNTISNNNYSGVLIYSSKNNLLKSNKINKNDKGVFIPESKNNEFYLNEFKDNTNHVSGSFIASQDWNSTNKITYFYNNINFSNYLGNYWDDYTGNDFNGDGIGETEYSIGSGKDLYPLVKAINNYTVIPYSTEIEMDETYSMSKNTTVKLITQNVTLNVSVSGDLNGYINFSDLKLVIIDTGFFKGKGFFKANWTAIIESQPYQGTWQGIMFKRFLIRRINLKGTLLGDLQGITEGHLSESLSMSGIYNMFNSTSMINKVGSEIVFAQVNLTGIVTYQTSVNSTSQIYMLQAIFKGKANGYYNHSLGVVITHVRIINKTHEYYGHGFSIISHISKLGAGLGWTYDHMLSPEITKLTGFFTKPLWGIVFGTLDESIPTRKLLLTIVRLEMGLPPAPVLDLDIWGEYRLYPGQTITYYIEYKNTGVKEANNTEIITILPNNSTFINCTGNGTYNNITHQITWRQNISAKTKTQLSVRVKIDWGLIKGTKLYCNGSIIDYIKNVTLVTDSYKSSLLCAKDPNMKYGPGEFIKPGQKLNYTIEFENEGAGTAYGVYFADTLSEYLDDSSLKFGPVISTNDNSIIANTGTYNSETRTITWFVGEVGAGKGGYANFSINVKANAAHGTEILNYGIVYFPSVPEITKTNGITSRVIINKDPIAVAGVDLVKKTYEEIIFDGSSSSDSDGTILNYTWDFGNGEVGYGKVVPFTYFDDGSYKVELSVMDNWKGTDSNEIYVQVQNREPEAKLEVEQIEVNTNDPVIFDASDSIDMDGKIVQYYFNFGDGSNSGWIGSSTISHKYLEGTEIFKAQLSVKDDDKAISNNNANVLVTVNNREPYAKLTVDKMEALTYEEITFSAKQSIDVDGDVCSYYFDFGDGTNTGWISTYTVSHKYTDGPKKYRVQVFVKDDDEKTSNSELSITIINRAPIAAAGSDQIVDSKQIVVFNSKLSSDQDGNIKSYSWDFGDGSTGTGKVVTHSFDDNGLYIVTLSIKDDDGAIAKDFCIVKVTNVKPVSDFTINQPTGDVNTLFRFNSTSYDIDGSISEYYWEFGDGSISTLVNPTHQYRKSGVYEISLIVQDDDGDNSDKTKREITLTNLPPVAIIECSLKSAQVGEKILFDATKSYDLDSEIVSLIWRFGDGNEVFSVPRIEYTFQKPGTYTITLLLIDESQNYDSATLDLIISNIDDSISNLDSDGDGLLDEADLDDDELINFDEYKYNTDPLNPDTDADGINDKTDTYPTDPTRPGRAQDEKQKSKDDNGPEIIIIIILVIGILASIFAKNNSKRINKPFDDDKRIRELRDKIIQGERTEASKMSNTELWELLESKYLNGEISEDIFRQMEKENIG